MASKATGFWMVIKNQEGDGMVSVGRMTEGLYDVIEGIVNYFVLSLGFEELVWYVMTWSVFRPH